MLLHLVTKSGRTTVPYNQLPWICAIALSANKFFLNFTADTAQIEHDKLDMACGIRWQDIRFENLLEYPG